MSNRSFTKISSSVEQRVNAPASQSARPDQTDDLNRTLDAISRLGAVVEGWDEGPRATANAYLEAVEQLHAEALRRIIRTVSTVPEAKAALRDAVADPLVYTVLRKHQIVKPSLTERVEQALDGVRPMLAGHGGDVELVAIEPPSLKLRFLGNCNGCPASELTFHAGVKKAIEQACPEITNIVQVKSSQASSLHQPSISSPFAASDDEQGWVSVACISDVAEGGVIAATHGTRKLLIARVEGTFAAYDNACAHLGLTLDNGSIADGIITCPHHGFRYDLASGECLTVPEVQLYPHQVRLLGANIEVRLQ